MYLPHDVDANISGGLSAAIARLPDNTGEGCKYLSLVDTNISGSLLVANISGGLVDANISGGMMDANISGGLVDANISGSLSPAIAR